MVGGGRLRAASCSLSLGPPSSRVPSWAGVAHARTAAELCAGRVSTEGGKRATAPALVGDLVLWPLFPSEQFAASGDVAMICDSCGAKARSSAAGGRCTSCSGGTQTMPPIRLVLGCTWSADHAEGRAASEKWRQASRAESEKRARNAVTDGGAIDLLPRRHLLCSHVCRRRHAAPASSRGGGGGQLRLCRGLWPLPGGACECLCGTTTGQLGDLVLAGRRWRRPLLSPLSCAAAPPPLRHGHLKAHPDRARRALPARRT